MEQTILFGLLPADSKRLSLFGWLNLLSRNLLYLLMMLIQTKPQLILVPFPIRWLMENCFRCIGRGAAHWIKSPSCIRQLGVFHCSIGGKVAATKSRSLISE
ncbi:uncharacterized protein ASCRUDRAFT_138812 [Ascoidea rubescens DSM 1968]|uniref:Uncharacterized protein n=1 Tax=Ascoidea rubescens DSM 1968 TaxID=1344418 RepID=A0A1D2VJT6_9ASCO|nr:hypothetical protein ASCRUDRAFT_138812 [Ascoidea rubescens DSM 1968]ODV61881.1 hypothetical protein ASCRUDRAFT_138812 [Ascoidea rubescens DSM 1968]